MKVVLRSDVDGLGRRGDLREVARGYARNYLLPKGLAIAATPGVEAQAEAMRRSRSLKSAAHAADARVILELLEAEPIRITARAGKEGKLFGSVGSADISSAIAKQLGATVERRALQLPEPLKALGVHKVPVQLHAEVRGTVTVEIATG